MKQSLTATKVEHFGIARKIIANMTRESWTTIPHAGVTIRPEATKFLAVLDEINANATKETKVYLNAAVLKVLIECIKACPNMNAHLEFNSKLVRGCVKTIEEINISLPMVLPNGQMMTVNLHDMNNKSISEIKAQIQDVVRRAKNSNLDEVMFEVSLDNTLTGLKQGKVLQTVRRLVGSKTGKHKIKTLHGKEKKEYYSIPETDRLTKHDIEQGTITISNLGSICKEWHGDCVMLDIIPPQICVIAVGAFQKEAVVNENNEVVPGVRVPFTLMFDHKATDLGELTPFMNKLNEIFANPEVIKEWL